MLLKAKDKLGGQLSNKQALLLFGTIFVVFGVMLRLSLFAAGPFATVEPEAGTLSGSASIVGDASASGSSAVKFASSTTTTCSLNATTANFSSQLTAATAGQTLCLAAGSYGTFTGINKAVTIRPQSGATATMAIDFRAGDAGFTLDSLTISGGNITGNSSNYNDAANPKNITIKNSTFTDALQITYLANANILLDHNTHNNIDNSSTCTWLPARIALSYSGSTPSGVTVQNSLMDGGNTDGIQTGTGLNIINNEFRNIREKSSSDCAHTDPIQLIGATGAVVTGNYIHNSADGIVAYDGVDHVTIERNVVDLVDGRYGIELYSDNGSIIRHNTLKYGTGCEYAPCGQIILDHKSTDPAGQGTVIEDNIATAISTNNGSAVSVNRNNMLRSGATGTNFNGTPVYAGGASPATYAGFLLAPGSPGRAAASDGTDVGI